VLNVFGSHPGGTRLYDDAGSGFGYQHGAYSWTPIRHSVTAGHQTLVIGAADGTFPGALRRRSWTVVFRDLVRPQSATVDGHVIAWRYDRSSRTLTVRTPETSTARPVTVAVDY
jgi:alpha-D-xyloside xylohydrolase